MKGLIKFMPALALVAFASCSSDDFFGNGQTIAENELKVTVEQFDNVDVKANTRAVREWGGSVLNFQTGDAIRVYDNDLFKYDIYSFANGTFTRKNATSNISTIKFAAFPKDDVKRGYWDEDGSIKLEMSIPNWIDYTEDREALVGDKIAYDSNLPMWGTAAAAGNGASASLYHLTGVLAINVKNMLQNVEFLTLWSPTQDIAGTFVATLNADDPTSVYLQKGGEDLISGNQIIIDLRHVPSSTSVIYVPILAGVSDLQVWADNNFDDAPAMIEKVADYTSTYTFQRNKFKTLTWTFGIGSTTPGKLTALLDAYKNSLEDELVIDLEKFYVGTNGGGIDANYDGSTFIGVPASENDITINFKAAMTYGNADNAAPLVIADADPTKPYTGKLTFNVGAALTAATDITIDLPKADVVLAGDFETNATGSAFNFVSAKSLTIGDGKTITAINSAAGNFAFSDFASKGVAELTVAGKATLTVTGAAYLFDQFTKKINVAGNYVGDIDFADNYSKFDLNVTGTPAAPGVAAAAAKITGNVWTIGDVNVALPVEGEAITGTLHMAGAEKTLALTQGYINTIENCVIVFGSWQKPENTIKLDNVNQGLAAFNTLTDKAATPAYHNGEDCVASETKLTTSVWDGNKITNNTYKQFTDYTDKTGANVPSAIMTASQLATNDIAANSKMMNNIDLNNKAWTGNAISKNLDGNNKTISNLKLKKNTNTNGLFKNVTADITVNNLTIDGVTNEFDNAANTLGAFAGKNTGEIAATRVVVKNINFAGNATKALTKVGGFVGDAADDLVMSRVTVAGSIDGYNSLGGFVGTVSTASILTFDQYCASTVTFTQAYNSNKTMDVNYGKIGGFIGTFETAGATLNIDAATADPAALNHDKASLEYISDTTSEDGDFYTYNPGQTFVGYCGVTLPANAFTFPTFNVKNNVAGVGYTTVKNYVEAYFKDGSKKRIAVAPGYANYATYSVVGGVVTPAEAAAYTFTKKN